RVALTGVRLLADQQLLARRLPGGPVDDGRLAGEVAARVAGRGRHGLLRCRVSCARGLRGGSSQLGRLTVPRLIDPRVAFDAAGKPRFGAGKGTRTPDLLITSRIRHSAMPTCENAGELRA